jgi:hypothetical protein
MMVSSAGGGLIRTLRLLFASPARTAGGWLRMRLAIRSLLASGCLVAVLGAPAESLAVSLALGVEPIDGYFDYATGWQQVTRWSLSLEVFDSGADPTRISSISVGTSGFTAFEPNPLNPGIDPESGLQPVLGVNLPDPAILEIASPGWLGHAGPSYFAAGTGSFDLGVLVGAWSQSDPLPTLLLDFDGIVVATASDDNGTPIPDVQLLVWSGEPPNPPRPPPQGPEPSLAVLAALATATLALVRCLGLGRIVPSRAGRAR